MRTSIELLTRSYSPVLGVAGAYVQALLGLKALARASITFSTPGIGRARLFAKGGGPVSTGRGGTTASDAGIGDLYRRHAAWLARRLKQRFGDEAEDFAQEAWRRLIANYADSALVRHPRSLLLRIATNTGLDSRRRTSRETALEEDSEASPLVDEPSQDLALLLEQIVLGLPEPLRDVFVLSRFGGLTNRQIAEQLGISPKTVEWRMTRALAHCAAQFRR